MFGSGSFQKGDWNGFWALLADNLANLVIAATICKIVLGMSDEVVFGHILPGLGVALFAGLAFYGWLGRRLAEESGRDDVTALPYGISTPVLFVYLFGVLGPLYFMWKDEYGEQASLMAWQAGVAACFLGGLIECLGSALGPTLKRLTPRAGMLGTLAGIALVFIATVPLAKIFEDPLVGFPALAIVFLGLIGGHRLPLGLPAGLMALVVGTAIGVATGSSSVPTDWRPELHLPLPVFGDILQGFKLLFSNPTVLAVILPIEIYNFIETMNNVESAEAAGDAYSVRTCQIADGAGTLVGSLFGSPFPTTVYIGHPAYKRLGSRTAYGTAVGLLCLVAATTGFYSFLYKLIPMAAVDPLLVFVGLTIVAQAFQESPARHGPAVAVALLFHVSAFLKVKMDGLAQVGSVEKSPELYQKLVDNGVHLAGHEALAAGAIVSGLLWGAIVAFLIDHDFKKAAAFSLAATLLTAVGVLHQPQMGWALDSPLTHAYLILCVMFGLFALQTSSEETTSTPSS